MSPEAIRRLNDLNRTFYRITATAFDATRQQAWAGWERLLDHLPADRPLRVLDVGCGNGRFGVFLHQHLSGEIAYHGIDNSPDLLAFARSALPTATFTQQDIITHPPTSGTYDLVVLFGVIHHVPAHSTRRALMRTLGERVAVNGLLAFAAWRFYEVERLRAKITDWLPDVERESGDYLLDWRRGERALRYCHYVDDAEHDALVDASGLTERHRYRADGKDQRTNQYSLLQNVTE